MKLRYVSAITMVILIISVSIGLYTRSTYTDYNTDENAMSNFAVAISREEVFGNQLDFIKETADDENIILAVKCEDTYTYRFGCTTQKVSVEKVFKGDDVNVGDTFHLAKYNSLISRSKDGNYNGKKYINMGYVNEMIVGKTYLVFLDRKIEKEGYDTVYINSDKFIVSPIFCYDDIDNVPVELKEDDSNYVFYDEVKDNEFFIDSEKSNMKIKELKKELFLKYSL